MFKKVVGEYMKPNPISDRELELRYEDMLNECYEVAKICGYEYEPARALKEVDPVAYRCGFADYISAELEETLIEVDVEYYDRQEYEEYLEEDTDETFK